MNRYLSKLVQIYQRAETAIINEIARLRERGLADYHRVAALDRVQKILASMQSEGWIYVPRMIEREFYVRLPGLRRMRTTAEASARAYEHAFALTAEQTDVVQRLTVSAMTDIEDASATAAQRLEDVIIGRREPDVYRRIGMESVTQAEAEGGSRREVNRFVAELQREGVTGFTDKAGRDWSLHTYCSMVSRTTAEQAAVLAILTRDPDQDLYRISSVADPCGVCAPFSGRVFSRSGESPYYPPLADAFGKVDKAGPNALTNTWLTIHPNCRCALTPWTEYGKTPEELQKIREHSSPATNPYTVDPRSQKAIERYRQRERRRRKTLADYKQWERYRVTIPERVPKTFDTFRKHKAADDSKYKGWERAYREANREARRGRSSDPGDTGDTTAGE